MASPFDYVSAFQQPGGGAFGSVMQGLQAGAQMAEMDQRRAALAAQAQVAQQKAAAEQAALERQQQQQAVVSRLIGKVRDGTWTSADFMEAQAFAPKDQAEALNKVSASLSAESRRGILNFGAQVFTAAALNPTAAKDLVRERAIAERNSGRPDMAKSYEDWARIIDLAPPENVQTSIATLMAGMEGGKETLDAIKVAEDEYRARIRFPIEMAKSEAEAKSAAVAARFAESKAVRELEEKGWNIAKLQNDIEVSKQNARIAAMQVQLAREGNDLKRQEIQAKLQEAQDKRDTTVREKAADLESARFNVDNMLNTATRILNTPKSVIGAAAGPISSKVFTARQSTADLEELVNTLGSQSFLAQIPNIKGMGALSNAEGEKLQAALQNFSLRQSPERLIENVKEAQRLLTKARKNMTARAGLPETAPDTPAGGGPAIPTTMQMPAAPGFTAATPAFAPTPQMPAGFRLLPPGR